MFGLDLLTLLVIGFVLVVAVVLVVIVVFFVVTASRNREVARLAGVDTVGGQAQAVRSIVGGFAAQSGNPVPAAAQSIEVRLHELDSLRARGVISYDEYVAARQRAIDGRPAT
jgi:uncharacterized membrane protein YqiK